MTQDEIIKMARQAGFVVTHIGDPIGTNYAMIESFAKLVAAHAVAKDREEFDIDELCARQNKIGYKQGYNAGVLAEREACAKVCDDIDAECEGEAVSATWCSKTIRARGEP